MGNISTSFYSRTRQARTNTATMVLSFRSCHNRAGKLARKGRSLATGSTSSGRNRLKSAQSTARKAPISGQRTRHSRRRATLVLILQLGRNIHSDPMSQHYKTAGEALQGAIVQNTGPLTQSVLKVTSDPNKWERVAQTFLASEWGESEPEPYCHECSRTGHATADCPNPTPPLFPELV